MKAAKSYRSIEYYDGVSDGEGYKVVYITGLCRSDTNSLLDFLTAMEFKAGDGYEKEAPDDEWIVWVDARETTEAKIVAAVKEWKDL